MGLWIVVSDKTSAECKKMRRFKNATGMVRYTFTNVERSLAYLCRSYMY